MASGYGNRSKWTVNELLTRNEQAKALGQKGLSNSQIDAGLEGAIGADLQAAGVHEQNLMNYRQNNRRLEMAEDVAKNTARANTMGGAIKFGQAGYQVYKDFIDPKAPDNFLKRDIIRPLQSKYRMSQATHEAIPGDAEMYGGTQSTEAANQGLQAAESTQGLQAIDPSATSVFREGIGQTTNLSMETSSALEAGTQATDVAQAGMETATAGADVAQAGVEAADMVAHGASMASKAVGPVGAAMGAAMSVASGNYAKAAVDLAIYGIGMAFGPIGMLGAMVVSLLPDSIMDPVYDLFS